MGVDSKVNLNILGETRGLLYQKLPITDPSAPSTTFQTLERDDIISQEVFSISFCSNPSTYSLLSAMIKDHLTDLCGS